MSKWYIKRNKCGICKTVMKKKKGEFDVEMNTAEGLVQYKVCGECAKFFNAMTDVLEREYKAEGAEYDGQ